MYYRTLRSTARPIAKSDDDDVGADIHPTDLIENDDCETCENCGGEGCEECEFQGYIDYSEPNGMN